MGWTDALGADIGVFAYDGDTPQDARAAVRSRGRIVLSNPDMLHKGILPHHTRWTRLFENLEFIIIDELHTYRGIFGSHVANVSAGFGASAGSTAAIRSSSPPRPQLRIRRSLRSG